MLAQVTYIQKFIMADSEDEFMPIFVAAIADFWAMAGLVSSRLKGRYSRSIGRASVMWVPKIVASAGRRRLCVVRPAVARTTPAGGIKYV